MDTICENKPVDTTFTLFGQAVALPVFAAPVGAMTLHYGDKYDDLQYNDILVPACAQAGIAAFTGDGTNPAVMQGAAKALQKPAAAACPPSSPGTWTPSGKSWTWSRPPIPLPSPWTSTRQACPS